MLINDLIETLEELPQTLAGAWAAWLFLGLLLSVWQRRDSRRLVVHAVTKKPKSAVRPPSGMSASPRPLKSVPMSSGEAFGELEALLEPPTGTHRMPGEPSAALSNEAHSPAPALAAPQSLP